MPGLQGFPDYDDGQPPSLNDFRRLGALAHNLRTLDAGDGAMEAGESGAAYVPPPDLSLWARLTAAGTGSNLGKYSWKQVQDDGAGAVVDVPGGMLGAFDGSTGPPMREVMLAAGLTVGSTTGQIVRGTLAEGGGYYWFDHAAPPTIPAAGITVKGVNVGTGDSLGTITGVTEEQYDLLTGFAIVSVSAGVAKVVNQAASPSHWGAVTNADQKLGGYKRFVPSSGTGSDGTYGVYVQNNATTASATAVLLVDPLGGGSVNLDVTDQTGAAGSAVARASWDVGIVWAGTARPTLTFMDGQPTGVVSAVILVGGGDGTNDGMYAVADKNGTLLTGKSATFTLLKSGGGTVTLTLTGGIGTTFA